jgi:ankyrin repeat protein
MKCILNVPNPALLFILQYLANLPEDFLFLFLISKAFYSRFHIQDYELWMMIASTYEISLPVTQRSTSSSLSLRSKSNYKKLFFLSYQKLKKEITEKNDHLILFAKELLEKKLDKPQQLKKLINRTFPNVRCFRPSWKCVSLEDNSLLTLSARYCHTKCMKLLLDTYHSDINLADMGGFSSLILCAYRGFMPGVQFCIQHGADIYLKGKLRSGALLTAEHWAAVQGHYNIFHYLRSIRVRDQQKRLKQQQQPVSVTTIDLSQSIEGPQSSFNYDNATFEDIFFLGNQPTHQNLQKLSQNTNSGFPSLVVTTSTSTSVTQAPSMNGDGSFCICGRGFVGKMIACDRTDCAIEWFHFECVGLTDEVRICFLHFKIIVTFYIFFIAENRVDLSIL